MKKVSILAATAVRRMLAKPVRLVKLAIKVLYT